jgi:hypothetical protein
MHLRRWRSSRRRPGRPTAPTGSTRPATAPPGPVLPPRHRGRRNCRAGWQDPAGTVERHASVWATDVQLDAAALRKLATLALDAAEELDQLDEVAQP